MLAQDGVVGKPEDALDYFMPRGADGEYDSYRAAASRWTRARRAKEPGEAATCYFGAAEDGGTVVSDLTGRSDQWSKETIAQVQLRLAAAGLYASKVDGLPGRGLQRRWTAVAERRVRCGVLGSEGQQQSLFLMVFGRAL